MEPEAERAVAAEPNADPPENWPCEPLREIALDMALRHALSVGFGGPRPTAEEVVTTAERFHEFLTGTTNTNKENK